MPAEFRSVQTFLEFIAAGLLLMAASTGLVFAIDGSSARDAADAVREAGTDLGAVAVFIITGLAYAVGVFADDLSRLLLEDRQLDRLKKLRLERFEEHYPGLFNEAAYRGRRFPAGPILERFGVMRMYALHHGSDVYAEVTNQVARLRLARVIFVSLLLAVVSVGIGAAKAPSLHSGLITLGCAGVTVGAFRTMRKRFERYVRAVERAFLVLALASDGSGDDRSFVRDPKADSSEA